MRHLLVVFVAAAALSAADWPRFRGPNGTGVSPEKQLPADLSRERSLQWEVETPRGHSSPVIIGSRLYLTGHEGDQRLLLCYEAATGKLLWRRGVERARAETPHPLNGFTTPTPATDGRSLFVFFPDFGLLAFDFDGNELWRRPLGPFGAIQGMAVSPVSVAGKVVLLVDTPEEAYLAAYDAASGEIAWKAERPIGFLGSYATPSLREVPGAPPQIVVAGAVELTGYDSGSGKRLWWARGITNGPASLPLVAGDSVYTVEPSGGGAPPFSQMQKQLDRDGNGRIEVAEISGEGVNDRIMHRLFGSIDRNTGDGDGIVTEQEYRKAFEPDNPAGGLVRMRLGSAGDAGGGVLWRHTRGLPYVTAPLLYQGVLYVVRNGGILSAFDPQSGKLLREGRIKDALGDYYASPVAGDGKIYLASKDGRATVLRAGADWEVLSGVDLGAQVIATPALAGGRICFRAGTKLACFGNPESSSQNN